LFAAARRVLMSFLNFVVSVIALLGGRFYYKGLKEGSQVSALPPVVCKRTYSSEGVKTALT